MKKLSSLFLLLIVLAVFGCATTPPSIVDSRIVNVPYSEANSHKNDVVRWGGLITDIENEENHSLILVEFHPLDELGRPQLDQPSEGEFVIKTSKPLDSGIYVEYSEVTVVGILDGDISLPVDEKNESLPLIVSTDPEKYPYLWAEDYHTIDFDDFCDFNLDEALYQDILGFSPAYRRSMLEEVLAVPVHIVVGGAIGFAYPFVFPILHAGQLYCFLQNNSYVSYDSDYSFNLWKTKRITTQTISTSATSILTKLCTKIY